MADHFSIGGRFFEGGNEEFGSFHGRAREIEVRAIPLDTQRSLCIMDTV
jgi:hypothetical protein